MGKYHQSGFWAGTIHTSAYLPGEVKAWFALGGDREPVVFDFRRWLEGEDIKMNRITGEVDTDIPFLHMDEHAQLVQEMIMYLKNGQTLTYFHLYRLWYTLYMNWM
ncbi:hypothetical protein [Cytobacillus firmus]|uniref:hypothetical protein n=1 Tax=Cytobacillus firmus TaxID=1399 RepID=UPI00399C97E2|nr:hypothetical protein [Cytobacillus firmus]